MFAHESRAFRFFNKSGYSQDHNIPDQQYVQGRRCGEEFKKSHRNKGIEKDKEFESDNGCQTAGKARGRTAIRIVRLNFVSVEKNYCFVEKVSDFVEE